MERLRALHRGLYLFRSFRFTRLGPFGQVDALSRRRTWRFWGTLELSTSPKNDTSGHPVDARILAHYRIERQPPLRPQLAVEVTQLDSLLKRRLNLKQALHQEQTRLSEMVGRPGLAPQVEESLRQELRR